MNRLRKILVAVAVLITLSSYVVKVGYNSIEEEKNQVLMTMVMNYLENVHYQPESLNDDFSIKAYDLYIKRLDYNKRLFLQKDIDELQAAIMAAGGEPVKVQRKKVAQCKAALDDAESKVSEAQVEAETSRKASEKATKAAEKAKLDLVATEAIWNITYPLFYHFIDLSFITW